MTSGGGVNYTYLGDSWVLAIGDYSGAPAEFSTGSFEPIPNQQFAVPNPGGQGLSLESDLRLVRINGDPGPEVPAATLATEPPPLGAEVVFIGQGYGREAEQRHWNVIKYGDVWFWNPVPSGGNYHGYKYNADGPIAKRWGTNNVADEDPFFDEDDEDLNGVVTRTNGTASVDTVTLITSFDDGAPGHEAQTIQGGAQDDSGSAVFYKPSSGEWQLAGVVTPPAEVLLHPGQSAECAVFGDATAFADISIYQSEIENVMSSHQEYSVVGDVNLDGAVTADDVAAFVAGWMYYNGKDKGDITSWKHGDISGPLGHPDGKTDVFDFLKMRSALHSQGAGSLVSALGRLAAYVPEPSSAAAAGLGVLLSAGRLRRGRRLAR